MIASGNSKNSKRIREISPKTSSFIQTTTSKTAKFRGGSVHGQTGRPRDLFAAVSPPTLVGARERVIATVTLAGRPASNCTAAARNLFHGFLAISGGSPGEVVEFFAKRSGKIMDNGLKLSKACKVGIGEVEFLPGVNYNILKKRLSQNGYNF